MKPIRILYTIPNFVKAGSGLALWKVIQRLDQAEFAVQVVVLKPGGEVYDEMRAAGIPIHVFPFTVPFSHPRVPAWINTVKTVRFFRKMNADIIHSFHYLDDYYEPIAARFAGKKWMYTKKNMSWGSRAWTLRTRLAKFVAAQNPTMISRFFTWKKNAEVVMTGVDLHEFYPDRSNPEIFDQYGITPDHKVILCVAHFRPIKGIHLLTEAFINLADEFPEARLVLAGYNDNEYGDAIRKTIASHNLGHRVVLTGPMRNVRALLNRAQVFVMPTLALGEGSPVALLEAMACGVIPLSADVSGSSTILEPFPELLFQPESVSALEHLLRIELTRDAALAEQLQQALIQRVQESFSLQREADQYASIYRRLTQ